MRSFDPARGGYADKAVGEIQKGASEVTGDDAALACGVQRTSKYQCAYLNIMGVRAVDPAGRGNRDEAVAEVHKGVDEVPV